MARMWFGVLGPVAVRLNNQTVPVTAQRQRTMLALLLLHAPHPVPSDDLIAALWPATRPEHTDNALHVQVSRLRRALGEDAAPRVETCATGYRTRIEAGESDLDSFRALLQTAERHAAAESWSRARTAAESALRLWRGDPGRELPDDGAQLAAAPLLAGLRAARATVAEIQIVASAQVGPAALAERRRPATVRPTGRSVRAG